MIYAGGWITGRLPSPPADPPLMQVSLYGECDLPGELLKGIGMPVYYPTPSSYYGVADIGNENKMCFFDSLTGGDQKISMVQYNVADAIGNVTTKFMPGQTTFEPVTLLRAMDLYSTDLNILFQKSIAGMLKSVRRNFSIYMFDWDGTPLVWWHLIEAVPLSISGFSFNAKTENNYTSFELSLQAESIYIEFADEGSFQTKKE
jgi:phage tail-like protein